MKKYGFILLVMLTVFLQTAPVCFGRNFSGEDSLYLSHWAHEEITSMVQKKWIDTNDDLNEHFNPDRCATLGEFVVLMNRFFHSDFSGELPNATDFAVKKGFVEESEDLTVFLPREEIAVKICKAFSLTPSKETSTSFLDDDAISLWAKSYVSLLCEKGIVIGYPDHSFQPHQDITWAEMITIIFRCQCIEIPELEIIDNNRLEESGEFSSRSFRMGIFHYSDGQSFVEEIKEKLTMSVGETVEFTIMIPEGAQDESILLDVENDEMIALDEDLYRLTANQQGITKISFYTEDKQFLSTIEIHVVENTEEKA